MRGKWLDVVREKNPLILNITNYFIAHFVAGAIPTLGREDAA